MGDVPQAWCAFLPFRLAAATLAGDVLWPPTLPRAAAAADKSGVFTF